MPRQTLTPCFAQARKSTWCGRVSSSDSERAPSHEDSNVIANVSRWGPEMYILAGQPGRGRKRGWWCKTRRRRRLGELRRNPPTRQLSAGSMPQLWVYWVYCNRPGRRRSFVAKRPAASRSAGPWGRMGCSEAWPRRGYAHGDGEALGDARGGMLEARRIFGEGSRYRTTPSCP